MSVIIALINLSLNNNKDIIMKIANKIFKASLLSLMISGTAFAANVTAPIGSIEAGANISVQNELGSFPVSSSYAVISGDQIKTTAGDVVAVAVGNGHIYVSPNSVVTVNKTTDGYNVEIVSGSVGYKADGQADVVFTSAGEQVTPTGLNASGAIALGVDGKLVVSPIVGDAIVLSDSGVMTTVAQGQTWINTGASAQLVLTQVDTEDDDDGLFAWSSANPLALLALLGGVAVIASTDDDGETTVTDASTGEEVASGNTGLPAGVTFIDENGVAHTGLSAPAKTSNKGKGTSVSPAA